MSKKPRNELCLYNTHKIHNRALYKVIGIFSMVTWYILSYCAALKQRMFMFDVSHQNALCVSLAVLFLVFVDTLLQSLALRCYQLLCSCAISCQMWPCVGLCCFVGWVKTPEDKGQYTQITKKYLSILSSRLDGLWFLPVPQFFGGEWNVVLCYSQHWYPLFQRNVSLLLWSESIENAVNRFYRKYFVNGK